MRKRIRALLIAEAANPEWASVPLEGWSHCKAIAEVTDAHVVTQVRNCDAIKRAGWREGKEFSIVDNEVIAAPIHTIMSWLRRKSGLGWTFETASQSLSYYEFERQVWNRFGNSIKDGQYDVVHRVTPLSPTLPSFSLPRGCHKAGVPFVWGPVNGGLDWPAGFSSVRQSEGEWLSYIRAMHRFLPGYLLTRSKSSALIAGSESAWNQFKIYHDKTVYIPENAVDPERFPDVAKAYCETPLRVAFVGRLVPYKGADMLISSAADLVRARKVVIEIIGDGPEMNSLLALCESLGIREGVRFWGWIPHERLQETLIRSHVLGFPSVREFGGAVVLEAMATGLVPIVVGYGGPNEIVSNATGFRVPLGSRQEIITGFRSTLEFLLENPALLRKMASEARRRVIQNFTWHSKANQVLEIYQWILGWRDKPIFDMPPADE